MAKIKKDFEITARIIAIVSVKVAADSLETAIVRARELRELDFITVDGEYQYLDGSMQVTSVASSDNWDTDQS